MSMPVRKLIVLKFGGMSLATPAHIKSAARRVANLRAKGANVLVVVSAMGTATDGLIQLAYSVSSSPNRRELDMLLSTGERVSMSLFSMALSDALQELAPDARAISFTGSQAGLLTDETHSNARIIDIKSIRVQEELTKGHVVILAGFQGVSPITKEITTLGRGGTDVTAVAMAAAFRAEHCEILKEVAGVLSADPRIIKDAKLLHEITHEQLLEMTFWGAKVLHYRSVELAKTHGVPLRVSLAHDASTAGTTVKMEPKMNSFETEKILAINSHAEVRKLRVKSTSFSGALQLLKSCLDASAMPLPQILNITQLGKVPPGNPSVTAEFLITSPSESLEAQLKCFAANAAFELDPVKYATITATCQGSYMTDLALRLVAGLADDQIAVEQVIQGAMSVTLLVDAKQKEASISVLHKQV